MELYKGKPCISKDSANAMSTYRGRDDTYFQVNLVSPVSTARAIFSSHNVASSRGSTPSSGIEKFSSSSNTSPRTGGW
jgi:hypothetical protein